jgi:hypothetical protein
MPNKERSGFGFVGDGLPQTGSAAFLLSARFTSAAYERVIRRIEWSAHITEKA